METRRDTIETDKIRDSVETRRDCERQGSRIRGAKDSGGDRSSGCHCESGLVGAVIYPQPQTTRSPRFARDDKKRGVRDDKEKAVIARSAATRQSLSFPVVIAST